MNILPTINEKHAPHIWFDPILVKNIITINNQLSKLDPINIDYYKQILIILLRIRFTR